MTGETLPMQRKPPSRVLVVAGETALKTEASADQDTPTETPVPEIPDQRVELPIPPGPAPDSRTAERWEAVVRAQNGDQEAFAQIYRDNFRIVHDFIGRRVRDEALTQDLTADTFVRAFRRIGSVTWQGKDICAWLTTIARNLVTDHYKSGRFRLEVVTGTDNIGQPEPADNSREGDPEGAAIDYIGNVDLMRAVTQLNTEQQECIVLRFLRGLSIAEVAHIMGKKEGAVKALQYRATQNLFKILQGETSTGSSTKLQGAKPL